MTGANVVVSALGCACISFCQCASGPSPSEETMPMPVIHTSRAPSAIGERLHWETDAFGGFAHALVHLGTRERHDAESECRVADRLAHGRNACIGDGVAGALVLKFCGDRQRLARSDETAEFRFLDRGQKWHPFETRRGHYQPARALRHCLDQQHAGHQRIAGEVPFENRAGGRNRRFRSDLAIVEIEFDDLVDQLEILDPHVTPRTLYVPLAATSSSMRAARFFSTKY